MSKARYIEAEFRTPENLRYGVLVLSADKACALIRRAEEVGVRVLGVDSLEIRDGWICPHHEHSVDFSARGYSADTDWSDALAFIEERMSLGFVFEVVLGDECRFSQKPNQTPEPTS